MFCCLLFLALLKVKPVKYNMMNFGLRSFTVDTPLPVIVRLSDSLSFFKSRLKTHLFKLAFEL